MEGAPLHSLSITRRRGGVYTCQLVLRPAEGAKVPAADAVHEALRALGVALRGMLYVRMPEMREHLRLEGTESSVRAESAHAASLEPDALDEAEMLNDDELYSEESGSPQLEDG